MKEQIKALLDKIKADEYVKYKDEWKSEAVGVLNEYYMENNPDDMIYDVASDEFEEIVKWNLEQRGAIGVKILLSGLDNTQDYARLDAYGNAESVDYDLDGFLEDILSEL